MMFPGFTSRWTRPLGVRAVERVGDLREDGHRHAEVERPLALEECAEVRALDVLHREEQAALRRLSSLVEVEDVRVVERLRVLRLPLEAGGEARVVGKPLRQHLQRAHAALLALGEVDRAHGALAEHRLDPVTGNVSAGRRGAGHVESLPATAGLVTPPEGAPRQAASGRAPSQPRRGGPGRRAPEPHPCSRRA